MWFEMEEAVWTPVALVLSDGQFICEGMGQADSSRNCAVIWATVTGIIWDGLENVISEVE